MTEATAGALLCRLAAAGVQLDPAIAGRLIDLTREATNAGQNLTSITDPRVALEKHLLDSLLPCALPAVANSTGAIVDVGSGVGFPGLALAAAFPHRSVILIESEKRKADWLARAGRDFPNVRVVSERSEHFAADNREIAGLAVARALGPAPVALELCAPLVAPGGTVALWRAGAADNSCDAAAAELGLSPADSPAYAPFPGADRHVQLHHRIAPTPPRFPRRPGRAAKRPLV